MTAPIEASTVGELLRKAAAEFGGSTAVVDTRTKLSFNALEYRTRRLARYLVGCGVSKGAHIGVSFGNSCDFVVSFLAVCRMGAVAVPVSTLARGRELLRLVTHTDLTGILTSRQVVGVDQVDRLTAAIPGLAESDSPVLTLTSAPRLRWIACTDPVAEPPRWATAGEAPGVAIDDRLLDAIERDVTPADVALMINTSGTTSDPKAVPHLHDTVCFRARYLAERMQYAAGDSTYTSQVLFWVGGLTMGLFPSLCAGATSVWSEAFHPGEVLELIESQRVNRLVMYPHQTEQLLAHPAFGATDRSSLRIADPRLTDGRAASRIHTPEGYRMALGMTETFGPYSWGEGGVNPIAPIQDIQPGLQVGVVTTNAGQGGEGEVGELVLRGRCVTPGYYKIPRGKAFDADGWFHTGDRAVVDGDSINYLGRMTEVIKTSGANVAPAEVVEALLSLEGVREAYVVPVPDDVRGQLVAAAVVLDRSSGLDRERIQAELKKDLSPYKVPKLIAVVESEQIPWTPTFKVRTHELAQLILRAASAD